MGRFIQPQRLVRFLLGALLMSATGCAGPYQPFNGSYGYSDAPLERNLHEVTFAGSNWMSPTETRYYATLRSAEIAVQHDRPYFDIVESHELFRTHHRSIPSRTVVETTAATDRRGRHRETTSVEQSPGYVEEARLPAVILVIRLLDEESPTAIEAVPLLWDGKSRGAEFRTRAARALVGG